MARIVDPSQGLDPENAAVLSGSPRGKRAVRGPDKNLRAASKRRDKFYVPPTAIPSGWVVEWKRESCLGRPEEPDYQMELQETGWKYADPKVYSMLVPEGYDGKTVKRGGMVLMTRPAHLKKEAQKLDREEAMGQVRDKLTEIGMTGAGELPRRVQSFNRDFDRPSGQMIPDDDGDTDPAEAGYEGDDMRPGA